MFIPKHVLSLSIIMPMCTMMDGFQFQFENETDTFVMTFKLEINALFAHLFTPREGKGEW